MLNLATRTFIALTVAALFAAAGYAAFIGDRNGAYLLLGAAIIAAVLLAVSIGFVGPDAAPHVAADAPAPERRNAYTEADVPTASAWPLVAGVAGAAVALGAATGGRWLAAALVALLIPAAGWLAQVWREHPSFSPAVRERVADRLVAPLAMPVVALVFALFIAVMVSRVLLAVPDQLSTVGAIVIAIVVLLSLALISTRPNLQSSALIGVAGVALIALVAAGAAGARAGERTFEHKTEGDPVLTVTAQNIKFSVQKLTVPASSEVFVRFVNRDTGTYHNVAIYTSTDPDRKPIYAGKPIPGGKATYKLETPPAGTYAFVCDFHPSMTGQLEVTAK